MAMDAIRSWFESKPDYTEKIPETLTAEDFSVHSTFHHGFPSSPKCLAYDPVQQILAVGTETGSVLLLGKPGLERFFKHQQQVAVLQMLFIINQGLLVTRCDNNFLYVWTLKEKAPRKLHTLEFMQDNVTTMSWTYGSDWMYVGTDAGNVQVVRVSDFMVSGYCIYWNKVTTRGRKPGDVIHVEEHPCDHGKLLLAYSLGLCVVWNIRTQHAEKHFVYDPGDNHIPTSVSWLGNGKAFACSYSDGSIAVWNPKYDTRPEKVFIAHDSEPNTWKPIHKLQMIHAEREPWFVFSGGFPEDSLQAPQTLTVLQPQATTVLSSSSTILDFLCLPSSPFKEDIQKPFALAILAQNELVVHDLQTQGFPAFEIPYALDIHTPSVTSLHYCANCPEEFIASLHSVKSKMVHDTKSTKMWPLKGGKWGEESPMVQYSDIIFTGHTDGSVRLWCSSSVIFQPFFTVDTAKYFKMKYAAVVSPTFKKPAKKANRPPRPPRPPPPIVVRKDAGEGQATVSRPTTVVLQPAVGSPSSDEKAVPDKSQAIEDSSPPLAAHSTSDQQENLLLTPDSAGVSADQPDGATPKERQKVFSKTSRWSIFRKGKMPVKKPTQTSDDGTSKAAIEGSLESSQPRVSSPVTKPPNHGNQLSPDTKQHASEGTDSMAVSLTVERNSAHPQEVNREETQEESVEAKAQLQPLVTTQERKLNEREGSAEWEVLQAPTTGVGANEPSSVESPTLSHNVLPAQEDFLSVQEIQVCVLGQWLCVANAGGSVLAFNFRLDERVSFPQTLTVDFDDDSVVGGTTKPGRTSPQTPGGSPPIGVGGRAANTTKTVTDKEEPDCGITLPGWVFRENVRNLVPGFHLQQHCQCVCTSSPTSLEAQASVKVSAMQYSTDLGLLVLGVDKGLAVIDTVKNSCLYTLSYLISLQFMADPSKYTSRVKQRTGARKLTRKPTFIRHATTLQFSVSEQPRAAPLRATSVPGMKSKSPTTPSSVKSFGIGAADVIDGVEESDPFQEIPACDSSVTSLELIHLLLDTKQMFPTLTLWVGTVSGYVVSYGINVLQDDKDKSQRKIELLPTSLIIDVKSPVVSMHFLNEWGDKQVVPYKPSSDCCPQGQRRVRVPGTPSQKPVNYAVIADETKVRSFSFPGLTTISKCCPTMDGSLIVKSEYFTCSDLPCLLTLTSCKHLHIHCLPGLKPLLTVPYAPLGDLRVMHTFRVSGDGQAMYLMSNSEIQRISVTKIDRLNLPKCFPDVYIAMKEPQPTCTSKGILSDWIGGRRTHFDPDTFFGDAGRPLVKVKIDGKEYDFYARRSRKRRQMDARQGGGGGGRAGGAGGGGLGNQLSKNLQGLDERGKKLTNIELQAGKMADDADDFSRNAQRLAEKFK